MPVEYHDGGGTMGYTPLASGEGDGAPVRTPLDGPRRRPEVTKIATRAIARKNDLE